MDAVDVFVDACGTTAPVEKLGLVSYASQYSYGGVNNTSSDIDQRLNTDANLVNTAIGRISARVFNGNTNIGAGIDNGTIVLTDSNARQYAEKTMVLLTDGYWNEGRNPVDAARDAAAEGITIHCISFGAGANQEDMRDIAEIGNGNYYHAPNSAALQAAFREIALTLPVIFAD